MALHIRVVLLAILTLVPHAAGVVTDPYAPTVAFAAETAAGEAVVSWLPGEELADFFNVYGLHEAGATRIGRLAPLEGPGLLSVVVPAGFAAYAVSGVKDDRESALVRAVLPPDCVLITSDPPSASVEEDCLKARFVVKVGSPP